MAMALNQPQDELAVLDEALAECAARGGGFEIPGLHHLRGPALDAEGRNAEALAARTAAATIASERGGSPPGSVPPVSRTADHPVGRSG